MGSILLVIGSLSTIILLAAENALFGAVACMVIGFFWMIFDDCC